MNSKAKTKLLASIALTGSLSFVCNTAYSAYGWAPSSVFQSLGTATTNSTAEINKEITKMTSSYITQSEQNKNEINKAISFAITQEAVGTVQKATADKNSKQMLVTALMADKIQEEQLDAYMKFGASTGQGYAACKVLAENSRLSQVMDTTANQAAAKVLTTDNAPGKLTAVSSSPTEMRNKAHNQNFCTESEEEAGDCVVKHDGVMAGADSNASTLFTSAKQGSVVSEAKKSVRQNILGSPTKSIPYAAASGSLGKAYLMNTNHKTALSAFPAYSLAYLESMSEIREDIKDKDGNAMSPNDMLFNTVSRYYGGKDAEEWQKAIVQQQPRGLLVELAKIEGLASWMDYQEFLTNQRLEGNLAAMTLTNTLPIEDKLRKQHTNLTRKSIRHAILSNSQK